ncbi:MAG: K+-dependent Na+/Ca+ exchanger [bacterium]|nr:MAG: K+-dependent Na+/Ca+ exchanger [bacterium]
MFITYLSFFSGFAILIAGAQMLVNGASSIGIKLKISQMVMGLTVVALGTSLPELIVNIFAGIKGNTDLAIGNILGSNITNMLLVVGVTAIIIPIHFQRKTLQRDIPFSLFAPILLALLANDFIFGRQNIISRADGIILLIFLGFFLYFTFFKQGETPASVQGSIKQYSWGFSLLFIAVGGLGLYFGGKWIVDGAVKIATVMGISQTAMGLTLVAGATSLPELATSIIAARKSNADMALGNAVGSNILNILLVLGVTALIKPIPYAPKLNIELGLVFASGLLLLVFARLGKTKNTLNRFEGVLLVLIYVAFIYFTTMYQ